MPKCSSALPPYHQGFVVGTTAGGLVVYERDSEAKPYRPAMRWCRRLHPARRGACPNYPCPRVTAGLGAASRPSLWLCRPRG